MQKNRFVVGKGRDLPEGSSRSVRVDGRKIALFNEGGELFALDQACPHMKADLSQGTLKNGILACSWHGWRFDVRTGRGLTKKWACLKTYVLRRQGEDLVLELGGVPTVEEREPSLPAEEGLEG